MLSEHTVKPACVGTVMSAQNATAVLQLATSPKHPALFWQGAVRELTLFLNSQSLLLPVVFVSYSSVTSLPICLEFGIV